MSVDLSSNAPEVKDQVKKIEEGIVQKINKYNEEIKASELEESKLHKLQSKAYLISEKYRKLRGEPETLSELEAELGVLETDINSALTSVAESKHVALVTLQSLYKEHIEYLSNVAKGLKTRCDSLEEKVKAASVQAPVRAVAPAPASAPASVVAPAPVQVQQPNIREAAAAALNTPAVAPVPVPAPAPVKVAEPAAPTTVKSGATKKSKRGDNLRH